jgi:ATP-dependent Clp protease ATP-binding subunit ClpA
MFERFTDRARRVVVLAQEEARLLNHDYIGTEHILLGLINETEGVAAAALESLGVSLEGARVQVEELARRGDKPATGHIPFTPRAKKALELSLREALRLGHNYIGTEHILLGLIHEGTGVGAQVVTKLGATLEGVREEVIRLLQSEVVRTEEIDEPSQFSLSSKGRTALALADEFAAKTGQGLIQPAHLLMGLIALSASDPIVRKMLEELGINFGEVQRRMEELSSEPEGDEGSRQDS